MNLVKPVFAIVLIAFAVFFSSSTTPSQAMQAGPFLSGPAIDSPAGAFLHRVDTFPTCAKVRRCWRNDYGQLRCGFTTRCQVCNFVKRCTRARGCSWVEKCTWGPKKPVLKSN